MNKQFIKVRSLKDIIISTSVILVGAILALLPLGTGVTLAGCTIIVVGIILALILKSGYREVNNPGLYHKTEYLFEAKHRAELMKAVENNPSKIDVREEGRGLTIRLDVYHSTVSQSAFIQLFEYVPYEYVAISKVVEYDRNEIKHIIK